MVHLDFLEKNSKQKPFPQFFFTIFHHFCAYILGSNSKMLAIAMEQPWAIAINRTMVAGQLWPHERHN